MLRVPPSSILRWAVLCGYALLVALGHGGWHLVTGEQCGVHGHSHSPVHAKVTVCSHGHRHVHPGPDGHVHSGSDHAPAPDRHAPHPNHHDSDHCAICAVFAAPQTLTSAVELTVFEVVQEQAELPVVILATSNQTQLPESRGPPSVA